MSLARPLLLLPVLVLSLASVTIAGDAERPKRKRKTVVPVFQLGGVIAETPRPDDMPMLFSDGPSESLRSLVGRIRKAQDDEAVNSVVVLLDEPVIGRAQAQEIRRALDELKEAGKTIYAHADTLTTGQLVLLSGVQDISMVPSGYLFITGLYGEQLFVRGLLDRIGVTPDFFTCGDYKSAAEMFMRHEPSPRAAEMTGWLFDGIFDEDLRLIAEGRGIDVEAAGQWIDEGVFTAERAQKAGIIDHVRYRQDLESELRAKYGDNVRFDRRYGKKRPRAIDLSNPFGLIQFYAELLQPPRSRKSTRDAVAIVYVEGPIMVGTGQTSPFGSNGMAFSTPIRRALDEADEDETVKAVVLRVNSPGGSAVASEIILDASRRVAANKPLVVSMGDVAASGGYYIASGSETIFADPSTITGSIGVVTGKFATTEMWSRIGVDWSPVKRGANSGLLSSADVFSESERAAMELYMNEVYDVFKGHVTTIRGDRLSKDIEELAGGRVYTGRQALDLGLVDELGGLEDAIAFAAGEAGITEYEVRTIPRVKSFMELMMQDFTGQRDESGHLALHMSDQSLLLNAVRPLLKGLDPGRVRAVMQAMQQLTILQSERVSLMMPIVHLAD